VCLVLVLLLQDLEGIINSFSGMAKLIRLIHIADHCPSLRVEALKMAISHVQGTFNVAMYQQLHKKLREAVSS
jgi:COP9 signalosome complex subunit 1